MEIEMLYTPGNELYHRISAFRKAMIREGIDGALIVQKVDLYYFSGTAQDAYLYIPVEDEPILMVKKSFKRGEKESALKNIIALNTLKDLKETVLSTGKPGKIGLELDVLPANMYLSFEKILAPSEIVDVSRIIRRVRMIKSAYELSLIQKSADLNFAMFSEAADFIKEGISEVELAGKLEAVYRKNGHQGLCRLRAFNSELFYGHCLSGWNLSYPSFFDGPIGGIGTNPSQPQGSGLKKIKKNEPIMIDYIGVLNGYIVDQARMFSIGTLPDKFIDAYGVALKIKNNIVELAVPGANGKDLYEAAYNIATEAGLNDFLMGYEEGVSFIGHGVGLELDELPVIARNFDMRLEPGMVFALEPKFIFPDTGAIGIEDTFVVSENGLEQLTYYDESLHIL